MTNPQKKPQHNHRFPAGRRKLSAKSPEPTIAELEVVQELSRGRSTNEVAKQFGCDWHTVDAINKRVTDYLRREYLDDIVRMKVEHSEKLSDLYREARQAWDTSKATTVRTTNNDNGVSTTTITSHGDPRFLAEARAALSDIRAIWGADAPIKLEHSGELRVAGKTQEKADAAIVTHVQGLLQQMQNRSPSIGMES